VSDAEKLGIRRDPRVELFPLEQVSAPRGRFRRWLIEEGNDFLTRPAREGLSQDGRMEQREPGECGAALKQQFPAGHLDRVHPHGNDSFSSVAADLSDGRDAWQDGFSVCCVRLHVKGNRWRSTRALCIEKGAGRAREEGHDRGFSRASPSGARGRLLFVLSPRPARPGTFPDSLCPNVLHGPAGDR
jgi:hypothetical protein